ncbi:NRAMP (natural resistance-associated macrophage protein)-like metal ion transporter [Clostridium acetobutylicum]|uniref:Mn transporter, NRAMP family n=1 Tax=Clostridium acetobutylicum (strain ATCC 824 / DSM 792 / JCM 1419 / IAM 19013 / LMG 5710 / NBRC 13948 / NRRL B-527 / VKM B-1787 / 2291 / W) TaxID=272562 RepID=Q97L77_CLOAB|nr:MULTISPECIES: Nramp family divalent metal transporter [Clostridium]AAK78662.1 Putative Mn transporter, NRAMP family [Clostridium acetobutylicum ATCC 824]ADZ19735.1 Putative Mn transporter, NRAMP family [Clostridium acetobutylicum EA 2018]AEI34361.1 Mn transporter [Clostridium acetobutylicum DSM 1731]AWV80381.1 divalent metal cation transporter [Clostridium acetobutylicum]MBC2392570.1 Nramp family divalent metal transporter [Clostridium acetobutylicum]
MKKKFSRLLFIFSIVGPGLITANAGNDAGGVTTYSVIGSKYGYSMLWGLFAIGIGLAVVQEMNARMAVVTGKGLSDLIRERYGVKLAFFAMLVLMIANLGVCIADFAGIAASLQLFNINKYISVPILAIMIWIIMTKGNYSKAEKVFLLLTLTFFGYVITAFMLKPNWSNVFSHISNPGGTLSKNYWLDLIGMVGTTITPYMQFYLQSSIVDKGISLKEYGYEKLDVYLGTVWGILTALFITICTSETLFKAHMAISSAQDAAAALKPLAGQYSFVLFGVGLFGASFLACCIIPLSTSYAVCEAFGFESGLDNKIKEAPVFFGLFFFMIITSVIIVLMPNISLISIILFTQQLAGVLCPVVLIFMIKLVNDKEIMGKHTNNRLQNFIAKFTIGLIIILTILAFAGNFV